MHEDSIPKKPNAIKPLPSVERLNELLAYDPETGVFRWRVRQGRASAGSIAGTVMSTGYRRITIDNKRHRAHRLAWKIMTGKDSSYTIDHVNRCRDDNRFANLREATRAQQMQNKSAAGVSEYRGVYWQKPVRKWAGQIRVSGKKIHLGYFHCELEAARAYDTAAIEHFGEFANLNFPEATS